MLLDLDHPLTFEVSKLRQIEALIYLSTNMISQLQESFPLRRAAGSFEISLCYRIFLFFIKILSFWNRKYKYYCLYFSFITWYPSFITFLWQAFCDRWPL